MTAREDWMAGDPRPVGWVAEFQSRKLAEAFGERLGGIPVDEFTCECCGKTRYRLMTVVAVGRAELRDVHISWAAHCRRAGGGAYDEAHVFFNELNSVPTEDPDVETIELPPTGNRAQRRARRRRRR